jgi:hypothetical protein
VDRARASHAEGCGFNSNSGFKFGKVSERRVKNSKINK